MNERVLYYTHEERRYRFKVADTSVSIERQAGPGYGALAQETFSLDTFPVLNELYWDEIMLKRLIHWYEADMGTINSEAYLIPAPDAAPSPVSATNLLTDDPTQFRIMPAPGGFLGIYPSDHPGHENLLRAMFDEPELPRDAQDDESLWTAIAEASGMSQEAFDKWMDEPFIGKPDDSLVGASSPALPEQDENQDDEPAWKRQQRNSANDLAFFRGYFENRPAQRYSHSETDDEHDAS